MGPNSRDEGAARSEQLSLTAQIVPDLATFAVDDGFAYAVPEALGPIEVGSIVRVPLGRRRVRGYVVDLSVRDRASSDRQLKEVISVSGEIPIFDDRMLRTLRWLATHYVAPLAAVLPRSAPPNLPRRRALAEIGGSRAEGTSVLPAATAAAAAGTRIRPHYYVSGRFGGREAAGLLSDVLEAGRSGVVVAATVAEAEAIHRAMKTELGARVVTAHSSLPAREVTRAWTRAATQGGLVVVGTREVALWPIHGLAMAIVIEEGRRAMKAPQTPTMHVREILRRRAAIERFQLVIAGLVPTSEAVAAGFEINEPPGRVWPLVEVVDRNDEPPGSGFVSERVRRSLSIAVKAHKSVFVLVNRRGYAPAFRCLRCKEVRRCTACGTAADLGDICRRCGAALGACKRCDGERFEPLGAGVGRIVDELKRSVDGVSAAGDVEAPVVVGTERDLPAAGRVDVSVAIDADGAIFGPNYRAGEDAFRLLARLAAIVDPGSGNRCIVQTASPQHPVITALRGGHPMEYLTEELAARTEAGVPPAAELMAIEVGNAPPDIDAELRDVISSGVLGPAEAGDKQRWLVEGSNLREAKVRLRWLVQKWRDAGAHVRVDVDPLDL